MFATRLRPISMLNGLSSRRLVSTLSNNPYIVSLEAIYYGVYVYLL